MAGSSNSLLDDVVGAFRSVGRTLLAAVAAVLVLMVGLVLVGVVAILGLFALAALRHVLGTGANRRQRSRARARPVFTVVALGLPLAFIGFILFVLLAFPHSVASDIDSLRITLSATEVALGAMLGAVAEALFGSNLDEARRAEAQVRSRAEG